LTGEEQWLFRQLGVFVGGFDLETAETIMDGLAGRALDVLTALSALVDQSLIQVERRGEERVRDTMLESIREYACEQLDRHGELDAAERGHTRYFLELAERADPHLRMHDQRLWYFRLEQEHDNFRTALRWLLDHDEQEAALRLASALGYFWWVRGHHAEGWRWLEAAQSRAPDADPAVRTRALLSAGLLLTYGGDFDRSRVRRHCDWPSSARRCCAWWPRDSRAKQSGGTFSSPPAPSITTYPPSSASWVSRPEPRQWRWLRGAASCSALVIIPGHESLTARARLAVCRVWATPGRGRLLL
jgi:hypothetical protein